MNPIQPTDPQPIVPNNGGGQLPNSPIEPAYALPLEPVIIAPTAPPAHSINDLPPENVPTAIEPATAANAPHGWTMDAAQPAPVTPNTVAEVPTYNTPSYPSLALEVQPPTFTATPLVSAPVVPPAPVTESVAPTISMPTSVTYGAFDVPAAATDVMSAPTAPVTVAMPIADAGPLPKPPRNRKRLYMAAGVVAGVLLLSTGGVFGLYLPNTPGNVWRTGLNRSGTALSAVVNEATKPETVKQFTKSQITATVDVKSSLGSYGGTADIKYDSSKLNGSVHFASKDTGGTPANVSAQFLANIPSGTDFPDTYFKISGLQSLGLGDLLGTLMNYDGKWISIDGAYLKSLGVSASDAKEQSKQLSSTDITELVKVSTASTQKYILTADVDRAVIVQKKFIGKETVDGVKAYHYTAGINKAHAKDYCSDLITNLMNTTAYTHLPYVDVKTKDADKKSAIKSCQDSIDGSFKDSDTFDMWVDAKYKLIHKLRFVDENSKDSYVDYGQNYNGGNSIELFVKQHDGEGKMDNNITLNANLDTSVTKLTWQLKGGSGTDAYTAKATVEAKPYTGTIDVTKPTGAIPLKDVLTALGVDSSELGLSDTSTSSNSSLPAKADDTRRQTDIQSIQTQLEVFFAQNGYYPSLKDMNTASWLSTNMKSLDQTTLKDPSGTSTKLGAAPSAGVYSYEVTDSSFNSCESDDTVCANYTLTATLSTGEEYYKLNLD